MTSQEAIKILEVAKTECEWNAPLDYQEAFDMAISALQAQEETVSRKVYEQISWERDIAVMQLKDLGYSLGEKIRTDGDTISRREAIDAVTSLCDDCDSDYCGSCRVDYPGEKNCRKVLEDLPSAQPDHTADISKKVSNSCGHENDLISRADAIDEWKNDFKGYVNALDLPRDDYNGIMEYIDELPSAQPEIIRCKDCKWKQGSECVRFADVRPFPDDFCSRAERRTDA